MVLSHARLPVPPSRRKRRLCKERIRRQKKWVMSKSNEDKSSASFIRHRLLTTRYAEIIMGRTGLEPVALRLRGACSTIELTAHGIYFT